MEHFEDVHAFSNSAGTTKPVQFNEAMCVVSRATHAEPQKRAVRTSERISRAVCALFARIHTHSFLQLGYVNFALNSEPCLSFLQMFEVGESQILLSSPWEYFQCYQRKWELQNLAHAD